MCRKGYHLRDQGMQPVQRFVSRCAGAKSPESRPQPGRGLPDRGGTTRRFAINTCKVPHICRTTFHTKGKSSNHLREDKTMKKNLQRFGASVLAAAMVAQSVALPAAAETTKIDSSVAQSVAASAASAASAVQSLPKFTSTADLIKQTAQTLAAQGEVHELEQDDAKLEATAQSKAGMSLAALENALADAMYANAAAGKINTEAYGLNKDEMASVMAATIKTYHLSSAVTDLGYETNAAGVVTAVTFTGSSGMISAMESMTNSDDEVIAQQADSYAQAYVAENSDTFAASAAADGHTYGEPKWYWNDTNPADGHTHTWKETPDGYWTKTDDGWAYTAVYTCEKDDAYQKVEGTVTKDTTDAKPGVAGKTVYSASVPADKSPLKKEYKEPTTRTDGIAALPCQSHVVSKDADGNFVATFNWEMKKVEGKLEADYSNAQLFYDSETGKISADAPVTIDWECTSITFKCAVCGKEIKTQPVMTMPVSVVVDQNDNSVYINVGGTPTLDTTSGGTGVTLVSAMDGGNWYDMQNNPVDASKVNFTYQSGDNKGKNSLLLYDSQKTAVYVDDQGNQVTNTYDVSTAQMNYYYFQLSQFNQDEAEYFGVVAPFWTSKGVQKQGEDGSITGTMGAIKVLCSIDPNDDVPPTTMAFMLNMLPQAFMSYVMNYGEALKAIRDAGLAQVAKLGDSADYVTKLLILHDWISQVAEFDMGSMGDITGGGNNDPIQMTAFGALLGGGIGAKGVEYGCICLGYASAFNYMVQNLPDNKEIYKKTVDGKEVWKTADEVGDNAVVDFAQILYYCDTSDTSVAGNAFGGGMFNNVHYFNAVKVNKLQGDSKSATMTTGEPNKNWYYVDVCYDDVNTECMAQTRVENAGDMRHVNFLVSPSGLEGRYSKYYDYIDSLYDGYTYIKNKEPDKNDDGSYVMNNGKPHYSYTREDNKNETRYTDTCYEDTWFTSICSPIYFDDNYFYYVDTTTNQNLYNDMRRKQAENGDSGSSGSGSSGNNSQMQQFMKKMQNQGPDTLEARPRNANYYIRKADSSSSGGMNFNMSSFTKTDDPFDIILMYYNDLKETSNNFNDDDSNAKVLAKAGTIYKIDTSATDKHTKVENNLNTECLTDAAAKRIYPALVHSTALYDGKLYFNVNNAIYRMDPTTGKVEEVKEYNTVYGGIKLTKDKDGNMVPDTHFTGMSMVIMDSANDTSSVKYLGTFKNHPLAGLTLRDSYSFATTTQQGQTVITGINTTKDQLVVSVGTNLSNTYKELDSDGKPVVKTDAAGTSYANRKSYKTESWNYNPTYNQNMSSSDEKNKNEEFMWCANLVETMPMSDMVSDLSSGATTDVSVEAWCDTPAYTQARTTKYGLTKGEKKYADGALPKGHTWALDELETKSVGNNVYLCSDCHTATESTPHTVTLPDAVEGVTLTLGTINNTYIKDDTVTLTVEKEGTDIVTVTAKNGDTDVTLTEVQEAAQDEAAAQATTEKAKTVYTFTMPDGDVTISVTKNAKTYAVNVASLTNGEITASAKEAAEKETVTLTAKPATGYALKAGSLKVTYKDADNTDKTVEVKAGTEANTYTFAMPAYPVNVSAEFVKEYKVTAATVDNGTVTVDPTAAVEGTVVTVTVKAADNYQLKADSLTYSYKSGEDTKTEKLTLTDGKATFKMPAADVTVDAKFEAIPAKTYGITSDVTNGTAKLSVETAAVGDTVEVTFTANGENYKLEESSVRYEKKDDTSTAKALTLTDDKYSFTMPDYDVVVKAVFAKTTHTVTCNVTNGTATVDPTGEIKEGTNVTVTFKPDEDKANYVLKENPKLDSGNLHTTLNVSDGVGTFNMDKNDVIITAEFVEPTTPSEGDNTSDNTNNGGEETQAIEAEERTAHGAAEKTTVTAMAVFTCTDKNCASAQFVDATVKQTSGVTTAAVTFNGKDYTAKFGEKNGWVEENGKKYWYEKGVKQGTTGRGKEIYDPDSDAWYWLDAVQGGAMTVSKDVYQESAAGQWADKPDGTGKWVRYDENGHMVKGWQTTDKGTYYFDLITGAMAKGAGDIDGVPCAFDEYTGIALDGQWLTIKGADFWYEKGVRQGLDGRGKEIYDPASDAWYWLDAVDQGKKATSKDVYQESKAGQWADRADGTGKWVRYDAQGHMIKGWSADKRYYFDPIYGTMAKGDAVIDGRTYHFDKNTGVLQ